MFRSVQRIAGSLTTLARTSLQKSVPATVCVRHKHHEISDAEVDGIYEKYFSRKDIDGWEIRKAMNDLQGMDIVPEPRVIIAALKACRRVNDYALAVRYLEAVQDKCGNRVQEIWPYLHHEIKPTLEELGILTPHEMGYNKPELALKSVFDM